MKPKKYKPLTSIFVQEEKLSETMDEKEICNQLLNSLCPEAVKIDLEDNEEICDYGILGSRQIIDTVSHFIANALIPFFEPIEFEQEYPQFMLLSDEFIEDEKHI